MTTLFETRYGTMECFAGDTVVCEALRLYGEWAQLELDLLARLVPAGGTVLDVGAFVGSHTLAFACMVGAQGQVHSFEPRGAIRRLLQSNVDRNGLRQVTVHGCGLGAEQALLTIPSIAADLSSERAVNFGGLALRETDVNDVGSVETVEVRALDTFSFDRLDLLKIDAEGMEPEVIAGAAQTIARHRPAIFAECNDLDHGAEMLRAFSALGYAVFGAVEPAYNPANFRGNAHNMFGDADEAALLAVPRDRVSELQAQGVLKGFADIETIDALALLLLHKAQYPSEVLASSSAARELGIRYASPLSRMQEEALAQLKTELAACQENVLEDANRFRDSESRMRDSEGHARAAEYRAIDAEERARAAEDLLREAERALRALEERALAAEHYRASSVRYWASRLVRRIIPSVRR